MNAGIVFEDSDVTMDSEVRKTGEQLKQVKLSLTQKVTPQLRREYEDLRKKLSNLTGSVAW